MTNEYIILARYSPTVEWAGWNTHITTDEEIARLDLALSKKKHPEYQFKIQYRESLPFKDLT